jgi:diaminohydroxyphosphoribosylaminopyrimidine deaminase/5-amino-6-(5-phosphoribosylamino)uracil reductase
LESAAQYLNLGFISRFKRGRPYVIAKIAMSLDGRIATASGESQWITSPEAREQVQILRAECGAIITGANTVLSDNPRMTVRSEAVLSQIASGANFQPPLRVVLDRNKRISNNAEILSNEAPTWHMTAQQDLQAVLNELAAREINQVLVEAGPQLVGALLTENLVDELVLFYAPKLLGHEGMPMAILPNMTSLAQHISLTIQSIQQVGPDICVRVSV